jgi:hypothetical protein
MHAQQIAPGAHFVVTADDGKAEEDLRALGAQDVTVPAQVAADRMLQLLLPYVESRPADVPPSTEG